MYPYYEGTLHCTTGINALQAVLLCDHTSGGAAGHHNFPQQEVLWSACWHYSHQERGFRFGEIA